jgi:hypothetical protein
MDLWFERLLELLEGYEAPGIYNADEMCLFQLPARLNAGIETRDLHGGKSAKERLVVLLCTNSDGSDKRVPIIIEKSARPWCFKNAKKLPVTYYVNSKMWMTSETFRDFLHALDASFGALGWKILLFVHNCATHSPDTSSLKNVKVVFYPPNCTSVVQPLDLGVIKCFKQVYKKQPVQRAVFDGCRERGPTQDQHPVCHLPYCFGMATSDPVHTPELFCEVWPRQEESRRVRRDRVQQKW